MVAKNSGGTIDPACLSPSLAGSLEDEIQKLKRKIIDGACERAAQRTAPPDDGQAATTGTVSGGVTLQDLAAAIDEATGNRALRATPPTFFESFFERFPPFACICFILCLLFGGLGLMAAGGGKLANSTSGFLDVAKIFAGALVGSTSTTALAAIKAGKRLTGHGR